MHVNYTSKMLQIVIICYIFDVLWHQSVESFAGVCQKCHSVGVKDNGRHRKQLTSKAQWSLKSRSNSVFRNNHALTRTIFCQEKYPHLLLSSREHRFHLRQCVKYSRILREGVKLERLKIGTPYAKHDLWEGWPDTKFHSIYSFKSFQLKNSQWTNKRKQYKMKCFWKSSSGNKACQ